jgi:phage baseplate assembly protein V
MDGLTNMMRREAARAMTQLSLTRIGVVSNYDPATYSAKVRIQPEDVETGWLPVASLWVGNGWGLFAPPKVGDVVEVRFQEGGKEAGIVGLRHYGDALRPLAVPSGEFWLQHASGSFLKFRNDGSVELHTAGDLNATVAGQANLTVTGNVVASASQFNLTGDVNITGDVTVDGEIFATGDITDLNGTDGTVGHIRDVYNTHTHPTPSGTSGVPNEQL